MKSAGIKKAVMAVIFVLLLILAAINILFTVILYSPQKPLKLSAEMMDSRLYEDLVSGGDVCFLGDSITDGTGVDGNPWYRPIECYITGNVFNVSKGGYTSDDLVRRLDDVPVADTYVVAIGTNDHLNPISTEHYVENIGKIYEHLKSISSDCDIFFIAPWTVCDPSDELLAHRQSFADALSLFCDSNDSFFIDSTPYILERVRYISIFYMAEELHPNKNWGVKLYSEAVLISAEQA